MFFFNILVRPYDEQVMVLILVCIGMVVIIVSFDIKHFSFNLFEILLIREVSFSLYGEEIEEKI